MSSEEQGPAWVLMRVQRLTDELEATKAELKAHPSYARAVKVQRLQRLREQLQHKIKPTIATGILNDPTEPPPHAE